MKNFFKRVTSIMLAAALVVTTVMPAYADEVEPATGEMLTAEAQTDMAEPEETPPGGSVPGEAETQAETGDQTQYIIYLPEGEGFSFSYDGAKKSADLSEESYTILLYYAGEDVSLGIEPDMPYSLVQMSNEETFLSVDSGKAEFKMPEADLMAMPVMQSNTTDNKVETADTDNKAGNESQGTDTSADTEQGAAGNTQTADGQDKDIQDPAMQQPESETEGQRQSETEPIVGEMLSWAAKNVTIEARLADGSLFAEDAVLDISVPGENVSEDEKSAIDSAITEAAAKAIAGEDEDKAAAAEAITALYPFHAEAGVDSDILYTVAFDEQEIREQLASGAIGAKILTYNLQTVDGTPDVNEASLVNVEDLDVYVDEEMRSVFEFITGKKDFALFFVKKDEEESEIESETELESESESESESEELAPAEAELSFGQLGFTEDGYYLAVDENGKLGTQTLMGINAENLGGTPVNHMQALFRFEFPEEIPVTDLIVADGKAVDADGNVFFELWKQDESVQASITDVVVNGSTVDVTVDTLSEEGVLNPFEGWELTVVGSSISYNRDDSAEELVESIDARVASYEDTVADEADEGLDNGIMALDSMGMPADSQEVQTLDVIPVNVTVNMGTDMADTEEEDAYGYNVTLNAGSEIQIVEGVNTDSEVMPITESRTPVPGTQNMESGSSSFSCNGVFRAWDHGNCPPSSCTVGSGIKKEKRSDIDRDNADNIQAAYLIPNTKKDENSYIIYPEGFWDYNVDGTIKKYDVKIYFWSSSANTNTPGSLVVSAAGNWQAAARARYNDAASKAYPEDDHSGLTRVQMEFHFYEHGTSNEVSVGGIFFFDDLDRGEGWGIDQGAVAKFTNAPTILESEGNFIIGTETTDSGDTRSQYLVAFQSSPGAPLKLTYRGNKTASSINPKTFYLRYHVAGAPAGAAIPIKDGFSMPIAKTINTKEAAATLFQQMSLPGYRFDGWYSNSNYTGAYTGTTSTQSDVDVYARFIPLVGNLTVRKTLNLHGVSEASIQAAKKTFTFTLSGKSTAGNQVTLTQSVVGTGSTTFTNVPVGTYTLTESADGMWKTVTSKSVTITDGGTATADFTNEVRTGSLRVNKTITGSGYESAAAARKTFTFRLQGEYIDSTKTVVGPGSVDFTDLPFGQYTLTETFDTSIWDAVTRTFSITINSDVRCETTVNNIFKPGNVKVTKTVEKAKDAEYSKGEEDRYSESVQGFGYHLYGTSTAGTTIDLYAVTDGSGIAQFTNVAVGTYILEEVSKEQVTAASGTNASAAAVKDQVTQDLKRYVVPAAQTVTVTYNDATHTGNTTEVSYHNVLRKFRITIHKKDREMLQDNKAQQDATLAGAVYGLYNGDLLVKQYTTDENASFTTDYFVLGDEWYIKELKPSRGYLADPNKYPIKASVDDIPGNSELNDATLLDPATQKDGDKAVVYEQVMKGSVKYYKIHGDTNETDKEWLAGAGFSVYELSTLEAAFGGSLSGLDDNAIVQWAIDTLRNNATQDYKKLYGTKTATVYADPSDADVTGGGLVKSFQYANGQTVSAGGNKNEYIVSELMTGADGIIKTPRLPYGRYLIVETTVPDGYVAAAPRVINITGDDKDSEILGDGNGTPNKDIVIWDADITAYIEIKKKDSTTGKILSKPGAKYVIHDVDGAYFNWYMKDRTTSEKASYKEKFNDLVVDYSAGYKGSYNNPYVTVVQSGMSGENGATYIRTTQPLPQGTYIIEEVGAPDQYVLQGHEGKYRVDAAGNRIYEVQDASDAKWSEFHQAMDSSMTGKADIDETKAAQSARIKVTINANTVMYDSLVRNFVIEATQVNDPAVGKLAVYAEGEFLKSAASDGKTIDDLIANGTYPGYTTGETGNGDLKDFHNYTYTYEVGPIEGSVYTIKAAEDILSNDGSGTILFHAGDTVTTVTTDANGHAWTEEIVTPGGTYYGLPIGKYTVEQTKAGKGFALSEANKKPREFEITYDGETVPITFRDSAYENPRQLADIRIAKYDIETEQTIAGAVFGLFTQEALTDKNGGTVIPADTLVAVAPTLKTAEGIQLAEFREAYHVDGKTFEDGGLPLGRYYVKEIRAPKGYVSSNAVVNVEAVYNENQAGKISFIGDSFNSQYVFKNEQTKVRINVMDYDTLVELDGAELVIVDENGNEITTVVSVHDGTALVRGLEVNTKYTVKEVKPRFGYSNNVYDKDGYVSPYKETGFDVNGKHFDYVELDKKNISKNQFEFSVLDKGGVQTLDVFNKSLKADISLKKTGETASVKIEGDEVKSITYEVKGLPGAEYTVVAEEAIKHPDGYSADLYAKGAQMGTIVTNNEGVGYLRDLPLGKYIITETKAPRGFVLAGEQHIDLADYYKTNFFDKGVYANEKFTFDVGFYNDRQIVDIGSDPDPEDPEQPYDPNIDKYLHTGVYKIGVDGEDEKPVSGAEFTLYAYKDIIDVYGNVIIPHDTKIETAVSDEDGRAAFVSDLPIGEYIVYETAHPYGYYSTDASVIFNTAEFENDGNIKFIRMDGEIRNAITVTRVYLRDDLTKNELEGASLVICEDNGNIFSAFDTVDTEGEGFIIKGLDPDMKYTIRELDPRYGYTNTVIIPPEMDRVLTKESRTEASFTIEDYTVNDDLSDIPDDIVLVIENAFVTGNINLSKEGEVLDSIETTAEERTILDKLIDWVKTAIIYELQKQSGAEFTVYASEDIIHPDGKTGLLYNNGDVVGVLVRTGEKPAVAITGPDGTVQFKELYLGHYTIKETNIPDGYVKNPVETAVTLAYKDSETQVVDAVEGTISYENIAQKVRISVTKRDKDNHAKKVEGAVFGLYAGEDITGGTEHVVIEKDTLLETAMTGKDGKAVFEAELPAGTYYIKELIAPAGYTSSDETITVKAEWQPDGRKYLDFDFDFFNEISKVDIIKYIAGTEEGLVEATLAVVDDRGKEVDRWITNGEPHRIEGLLIGREYTLTEVVPSPGYITAKDVKFTVADRKDGKYEPQQVVMEDEPTKIQTDVVEKNFAGETKPLDGVELHIEDMYGNTVVLDGDKVAWVSKNGETGYYEKVPIGDYKIVVDSVPEGYVVPEDQTIHVEDTPDLQHFLVEVGTIIIDVKTKDKETGKPVPDVYVDVTDPDGKVLYRHVTPEWVQEYVPAGEYVLHVTEVPDGYVMPDPIPITVKEVSEMQEFVIELEVTHIAVRPVDKETKKPVKGVKMHLEDEEGNIVAKWTSKNGWKYYDRLTPGKYLLVVDNVPEGYKQPAEKWIKIKNTADLQKFEVILEKIPEPAPAPSAPTPAPQTGDNFDAGQLSVMIGLILALIALGLVLIFKGRKATRSNS